MDPEVAGAFIDDSPSETHSTTWVFGVRLRKFSNWHRFLLSTIDSPLLNKGEVSMHDLRVAVGICKLRSFHSRVKKPWIVPTLIYARALWAALRHRKVIGSKDEPTRLKRSLKPRVEAFLSYCGEYLQDPEYTIIPPKRSGGPDTPRGRFDDVVETVSELINWGIPEHRAWDMPIGQARVYRIMARRAAGLDVDIMTDEEREFQSEMRAANLNKQKVNNGSR